MNAGRLGGLPLRSVVALLPWLAACGGAVCPATLHTDPRAVLDAHRSMRTHARAIRAEARVDQRDRSGRIRGTVMMFVEAPNRVRFDAMTQFGPVATLTSDGAVFRLADLRDNRYLEGPTCPENIARLLGLHMSGDDVTQMLLGNAPTYDGEPRSLVCEDGVYSVDVLGRDGGRQELDFAVRAWDVGAAPDQQRLRLARAERFGADGRTEWRVTYDDYRVRPARVEPDPHRGIALPYYVRFEDPRRGLDTVVRFESIELNAWVPDGAFSQQPPPGVAAEEVLCD